MSNPPRKPFSGRISPDWSVLDAGARYTADQLEFLQAVTKWKSARGGRMPEDWEILQIAKKLGYRRLPQEGN